MSEFCVEMVFCPSAVLTLEVSRANADVMPVKKIPTLTVNGTKMFATLFFMNFLFVSVGIVAMAVYTVKYRNYRVTKRKLTVEAMVNAKRITMRPMIAVFKMDFA